MLSSRAKNVHVHVFIFLLEIYVLWREFRNIYGESVPLLCTILQLTFFLQHLKPLLVIKGTNFTTVLYCHQFGSRDVIGHVTKRSAEGGFL